jgi:outer membrane protein
MKKRLLFLVCFWLLLPAAVGAENLIKKGEVLDLQRCIAIAMERHPSIQASAGTIIAGESRIGQARSGFYPQLNGSAGYSRTAPTSSSVTSAGTVYNSYSSSISLSQTSMISVKHPRR